MDDRTFRNAMGKFATGVTVITTEVDGEVHGMTANAFLSVSLNPKLVLISIGEKAKMLDKIKQSKTFAVNILSENQQEISKMFAGQIKEKQEMEFERLSGLPIIKDSIANISCQVYNQHIEGDHTLFIGEVMDIFLPEGEGEPLTFYQGQYRELAKVVDIT